MKVRISKPVLWLLIALISLPALLHATQVSACYGEATVVLCDGNKALAGNDILEETGREHTSSGVFDLTHCMIHAAIILPESTEAKMPLMRSKFPNLFHTPVLGKPTLDIHRPPRHIS